MHSNAQMQLVSLLIYAVVRASREKELNARDQQKCDMKDKKTSIHNVNRINLSSTEYEQIK